MDKLSLRTASLADLEALPGIGPWTASHLFQWLQARDQLTDLQELSEVRGIGPKKLARLVPLVRP